MNELLPTILTAFATTMATKGAEAPANTFNEAWKYVFGPIDSFLIRKNTQRQLDTEYYIKSLTEKVEQIPLEQIQEPKMSILGPALEASKFYIEEEEIREMFASLLASSFDSAKNPLLHHSFVEIIKQLSPLDARNLVRIVQYGRFPVAQYKLTINDNGHSRPLKQLVFIPAINSYDLQKEQDVFDYDKNATSINNLVRLGLIDINFNIFLTDDSEYELLSNNPFIEALRQIHESDTDYPKVDIAKGIIDVAAFGRDFYDICLS